MCPTFQEEEEVGNLQLAWEMLEVAKVIYKRLVHFKIKLMVQEAQLWGWVTKWIHLRISMSHNFKMEKKCFSKF